MQASDTVGTLSKGSTTKSTDSETGSLKLTITIIVPSITATDSKCSTSSKGRFAPNTIELKADPMLTNVSEFSEVNTETKVDLGGPV